MFLTGLDDEDQENMTKGFETFLPSHTLENNNMPWNYEDVYPFTNMFMKPDSDCGLFLDGQELPAIEKRVDFGDFNFDVKKREWRKKHTRLWSERDVMMWIMDTFTSKGLSYDKMDMDLSKFRVKGDVLYNMSEPEFKSRNKTYGSVLFNSLAEHCREEEKTTSKLITLMPLNVQQYKPFAGKDELAYPEILDYDGDNKKKTVSQTPGTPGGSPDKRPVGRPKSHSRKRSAKKFGRLWEFIRDMLHNPSYCPSIIRWVDHDKGLFKFERSDAVAKVWGEIKKNPKMNYEKLSRAMRYYYKSKVFMAVEHQRLVYRFGPNAKGWQTDNPNFEKPMSKL